MYYKMSSLYNKQAHYNHPLSLQTAILLLRIDDIVSGTKRQSEASVPQAPAADAGPPPGE